jgi:tRNA1Val (adenine37-N6)-methyltransferase
MIDKNFSVDSIWDPSIQIQQSKRGYRFGLDAVLLAHFLRLSEDEEAIEIGCGNGIILILLSRLKKYKRLIGVEIQKELADLAQLNIENNEAKNIEILHEDARRLPNKFPQNTFHLIYSNPPYRKVGTGKLNPSTEKAIARHELQLTLKDLINLSDQLLTNKGRLSLILPAFREQDWMKLVETSNYSLQIRQYVHSFPNTPVAFVLTTVSKQKDRFQELAPLTIYEKPRKYTQEMEALLTRELDAGS